MAPPRITSFLVKVASRCNLDCDYCYVYHHADQSWRAMPRILSAEDQTGFANQLALYAREQALERCVVILHGGEPLLIGADAIVAFVEGLRDALGPTTRLDVGLQTNGLLLTDAVLDQLEAANVSVSLSLDGPRAANDLHRNSRKGRSSFERVLAALERLKRRPKIFAGVIAVIDPRTSPEALFAFFDGHAPPKLDILLPDSHHGRPPPGREEQPTLYRDWLLRAFDLWFDQYPHLQVRTFEALLDATAGLASGTDAFGLGDVSLISIETDGSYHDLDVLKVVAEGATKLSGSVRDTPIAEIAAHPALAAHRKLLARSGLSPTCQACSVVEICGGGSLPHRYGPDGFNHPSVYCGELLGLIEHVRRRVAGELATPRPCASRLPPDFDLLRFERAESGAAAMTALRADARVEASMALTSALQHIAVAGGEFAFDAADLLGLAPDRLSALASDPGVVAWARAYAMAKDGRTVRDMDGAPLTVAADYVTRLTNRAEDTGNGLMVGRDDPWLRAPFGEGIVFEPNSTARAARPVVAEALRIVRTWRPALADEMALACRDIQFVRDPAAHPEKIVSFSDNSVPGALYVSVRQGEHLIDPYDLADSLIHEHRHQKLYLLERLAPTVEASDVAVVSPWREELRPPSGLLHAVFVFIELRRFWLHILERGPARLHNRAVNQLEDTDARLADAFATLDTCPLTEVGRALAEVLKRASAPERVPA